jgi:hypothetical protein
MLQLEAVFGEEDGFTFLHGDEWSLHLRRSLAGAHPVKVGACFYSIERILR